VQCKQDSVKLGGYWYQHSGTGIHGRDDVFCCVLLRCAVLCCAVLCSVRVLFFSFLFFFFGLLLFFFSILASFFLVWVGYGLGGRNLVCTV
jgi:hypothetical protein